MILKQYDFATGSVKVEFYGQNILKNVKGVNKIVHTSAFNSMNNFENFVGFTGRFL